jgi:hypothetical protein
MHPELECGVGEWDHRVYGNHRIVVRAPGGDAVRVVLPWRRHDEVTVESAGVIVTGLGSGRRVRNAVLTEADAERGVLVFEPIDGPGEYAVYYLPYADSGSGWYPQAAYLKAQRIAAPGWRHDRPVAAEAVRYEAASAIDSFAPLGFAATAAEVATVTGRHPDAGFLLFGEDRAHGIGRASYLPARWNDPFARYTGTPDRGEFFVFQVGLFAVRDVTVEWVDVKLPFEARSLVTGGIDARGNEFSRSVEVGAGRTQSLWIGVEVPADAEPGRVDGAVLVTTGDGETRELPIRLEVSADVVEEHGAGDLTRLARLRWLDSTLGHGDDAVEPYPALRTDGHTVRLLGRAVELGPNGLPARLTSYFDPARTGVQDAGRELLAAPITFGTGWRFGELRVRPAGTGRVTWSVTGRARELRLELHGELESDGFAEVRIELIADRDTELSDAVLRLPLRTDVAKYLMGLGQEGRTCPEHFDWTWNVADHNQDALWVGDVDAGVQLSLRDENYRRPLNTNYYREQPLRAPRSWSGGGVRLRTDGETRTVEAFGGPLRLAAGESLRFDLRLLLTPFRPISPRRQLTERYFHAYADPEQVAAYGASVVNLHHANQVNTYINDPLLTVDAIAAYTEDAHRRGLRVKLYDTVRELTRHTPEVPALAALGDEVFASGPGGGHAWLQEHLDGDYVPGWVAANVDDVAIVTSGDSRWHNAYVEGIARLKQVAAIDGLYLDDVGYDRVTMKRVRRVLGPDAMIDLHSARQFNPKDGYASSANLYLELLPYIDRLWLGEYVDYENTDPAYWLVELSGIPFGLMGEMLQDGGNPWRGMVFGMTGRAPMVDTRPLWQAWDALGLTEAELIGWWVPDRPVRTGRDDVLATTWVGVDRVTIALASWSPAPVDVSLEIDWDRLGLEPADLHAMQIDSFQPARVFGAGAPIRTAPAKGWLLGTDPLRQ